MQHEAFTYSIEVMNNSGVQKLGMVRVFLATKFDENGNALNFTDQRLLMIELDKFQATCEFVE